MVRNVKKVTHSLKCTTYPVIVLHAGRRESATTLLWKPQKAMNADQFKGEEGLFFFNKVKTKVCIFCHIHETNSNKNVVEEYETVQC